jgi:hypothetical protein
VEWKRSVVRDRDACRRHSVGRRHLSLYRKPISTHQPGLCVIGIELENSLLGVAVLGRGGCQRRIVDLLHMVIVEQQRQHFEVTQNQRVAGLRSLRRRRVKVGLIQTRVDRSHCDIHVTRPRRVGVSLPRSCCLPHFFCIYKPLIH